MWTPENRGRDRSALRYPSDVTDHEWALIGWLIPPAKRGGNKRTVDVREVVNGVMYILSTGCQWTALPKDLPAAQHGQRLLSALGLRWNTRSHPSCALRPVPGDCRSRRQSDGSDHRQPERQERAEKGALG
jgi:hypothetical protein